MNFFDLHCDTLYKAVTEKSELDNPSYEVKLNNNSKSHRLQCYAIWLPDTLDGNAAEKLFFESADYLKSECNRLGIELLGIGEFTDNTFQSIETQRFYSRKRKSIERQNRECKAICRTWRQNNDSHME